MLRTYSELLTIPSYEERFEYLKLGGKIGVETFGFDRYLNQAFYNSREWQDIRRKVILRDNGFDLAMPGYNIAGGIVVHHMNPITIDDIKFRLDRVLNPELLISTAVVTHKAIHYGDIELLPKNPITRTKFDTCPWRL